jgi:hypothetical protein
MYLKMDPVKYKLYISGLSIRGGNKYFYLPKMVFGTS